MKIISKFQDYYDCGQFLGINKELLYVRHTSKKPIMLGDYLLETLPRTMTFDIRNNFKKLNFVIVNLKWIVFCGKIYPLAELKFEKRSTSAFVSPMVVKHVYDIKSFRKEMLEFITEKEYVKYIESSNNNGHFWQSSNLTCILKHFKRDYSHIEKDVAQIAEEKKSPIALVEIKKSKRMARKWPISYEAVAVTLNPRLADYAFYRVEDSYSAFSEIEMFIGGVMSQAENEIIQISDKDMRDAKGFDCYSFKKEPTKRKRKACKVKRNNV